jgi:hypothetical protein
MYACTYLYAYNPPLTDQNSQRAVIQVLLFESIEEYATNQHAKGCKPFDALDPMKDAPLRFIYDAMPVCD